MPFHFNRTLPNLLVGACLLAASITQASAQSLAEAYEIIAGKQLVDLTHSFSPDTPVRTVGSACRVSG